MLNRLIILLAATLVGSWPVFAGEVEQVGAVQCGYERFVDSCESCQGVRAKGHGEAARLLSKQPADLTQLSKNNDDHFPLKHVYNVIDGRENPDGAHGLREMPVWGELWSRSVPAEHAEAYVHSRILEIILYLESVQE